jgi:hypothetical protein
MVSAPGKRPAEPYLHAEEPPMSIALLITLPIDGTLPGSGVLVTQAAHWLFGFAKL